MSKKVKIEGNCDCGGTLEFMTHIIYIDGHYSHSYTVPTCKECLDTAFEVRQINHRRYKLIEEY